MRMLTAAWEMLGCLCNGGTLVIRGNDWRAALAQVNPPSWPLPSTIPPMPLGLLPTIPTACRCLSAAQVPAGSLPAEMGKGSGNATAALEGMSAGVYSGTRALQLHSAGYGIPPHGLG